MPSKRKQTDGNSPVPGSDKNQTPLQIAQRKKIKAVLHQTGTPGDSSSGSTDTNLRARKKHRMIAYNRCMKDLNDSFAAFAKAEEEKISRQLEAGKVEELDYSEACLKYIIEAREIHDRYFPSSGDVLAMGTNEFGQTGHGENVSSRMRPAIINALHNANTIQAAAGGLHSLSVNMSGVVSSWGANDDGALGLYKEADLPVPAPVKGFVPSALEESQYLTPAQYTWSDLAATPTNMTKYSDADNLETKYQEKIDGVDAGDCHSLALSSTGRVYFWGSYKDTEGKAWRDCPPADDPRVHPDPEKRSKAPGGKQDWPMHVTKLKGEAIQISCGFCMNAAIVLQKKEEGDTNPKQVLLTWGLGENGELARPVFGPLKKTEDEINALPENAPSSAKYHVDKLLSDYLVPKPATFADGLTSRLVEKVVCGGYHMLVIARDSNDGQGAMRIYSSGLNNYGQLGLGDHGTARHALTKVRT